MKQALTDQTRLAQAEDAIGPFIALIERELTRSNIQIKDQRPNNINAFARWYHTAVVALEASVAGHERLQPTSPRDVQMMCRCALTAGTLAEALELLCEFTAMLHPRIGELRLHLSSQSATLSQNPLRQQKDSRASLVNITGLFSFYQLMQWLVEAPIRLDRIDIGPVDRDDLLPFIRLFDAPAIAGTEHFQLHFSPHYLQLPVSRDKAELNAFLECFPCEIFSRTDTHLPRQVESLFVAAIHRQSKLPRIPDIARTLRISPASLQRSLAREGTSIGELKTAARMDCLRFYWLERNIPLNQVSRRLGFSDDISFRRAFYRWTGCSPTQWRRREAPPA